MHLRSGKNHHQGQLLSVGRGHLDPDHAPARPANLGTGSLLRPDALESVILVDTDDNEIGFCGKLPAHRNGKLHRAFSILISNNRGELLLQRRAGGKYHFASLWSNTCCGHPRPGEAPVRQRSGGYGKSSASQWRCKNWTRFSIEPRM